MGKITEKEIYKDLSLILGISENDPLEIHCEGTTITVKKYEPDCTFCGSSKNVVEYKGKIVCEKCLSELKKM